MPTQNIKTLVEKAIRTHKPKAEFSHINKSGILYTAIVSGELTEDKGFTRKVFFLVPLSDVTDATFLPTMPSQLLIRWMLD